MLTPPPPFPISMFQWQNMLCLFCFFINIDTGGEGGSESEWIYAENSTLATNYVTDCRHRTDIQQ